MCMNLAPRKVDVRYPRMGFRTHRRPTPDLAPLPCRRSSKLLAAGSAQRLVPARQLSRQAAPPTSARIRISHLSQIQICRHGLNQRSHEPSESPEAVTKTAKAPFSFAPSALSAALATQCRVWGTRSLGMAAGSVKQDM